MASVAQLDARLTGDQEVAQLDACLTGDQEVAGSASAEAAAFFHGKIDHEIFSTVIPFLRFKKGSCQFLAKECAQYWLTA